ncbi:MAG TPA: hypothetical protein VIT19_12000 [Pyrinomonadaceae bacterium]
MAARAEVLNTGTSIDKRRAERIFYTAMSVAILITVFAGFSRTFFLRPYFQTQPLMPFLIAHGIIFSGWIVLFLTQTTLIVAKRTRLHMRLGIAGGLLASLMIIIGVYTALVRAKGPSPIPDVNPLSFLTIPLGDMLLFGILVGAALYFRRRADTHKRLMLLSTIAILPAAVARLPFSFIETGGPLVFFGLSDLFILPMLVFDIITRGHPHRATLLGGALIVISHPLRMVIGGTQAWLAFATWITQWV